MQRSDSVSPSYSTLLNGIHGLKQAYKGNNPDRLELITLLEKAAEFTETAAITDEDKAYVLLGAYTIALERIEIDRGFGHGSSLRDSLFIALGVTSAADLDDTSRYIAVSRFRDCYVPTNEALIINHASLLQRTLEIQKILLKRLGSVINEITHALPVEQNLDQNILKMVDLYTADKVKQGKDLNNDRLTSAQLIQIIANLNQYDATTATADTFAASYRIKLGLLIHTMYNTQSRTYFGGSELYKECAKALNIHDINDVSPEITEQCLLACHDYLSQSGMASLLEKKGRELFGQGNLIKNYEVKLQSMKKAVKTQAHHLNGSWKLSTLSLASGVACGGIAGILGYAGGASIGDAYAQSTSAVATNLHWSKSMAIPLNFVLGSEVSKLASYYATSLLTKNLSTRAIAKVVEAFAVLTGFGAGAVAGVVLFQVTPFALKMICDYLLEHHPTLVITDPTLAAQVNVEFINELLRSPELESAEKEQLERVTGLSRGGLFGSAAASSAAAPSAASAAAAPSAANQRDEERDPLLATVNHEPKGMGLSSSR